jgi:hypothetical protein
MNNKTKLTIIAIVIILIILFVLFRVFNNKTIKVVATEDAFVNIGETKVEFSDLQHYIDTQKAFNDRINLYDVVTRPNVEIISDLNVPIPAIVAHHVDGDTQNVHCNNIQKNLKGKYSSMHQVIQPDSDLKDEIVSRCKDDIQAKKVYDIIGKIQGRNAYLTNFNSHEINILQDVWFSGNNNVKDQLINEILDCTDEYDTLYCPTGVASRIVSASYIDTPEKAPKTKEILNQEIMHKFGINYSKLKNKDLAKEKTVDEYYGVYPREDIEKSMNEWIDFV